MAARGRVALLAGLEARHLMSGLRWAFYAAGTDVQEDRDLSERLYQVYVVVIAAVVAALSWGQVISLVGVARDGLGTTLSASLAAAALVAAPALAILVSGVSGLRESPLRLSAPDAAWLARTVRPEELLAVQLVKSAVLCAAAGALGGSLLGVLATGPLVAWALAGAAVLVLARLFVLDTVLPRSAAEPRRRRAVTTCAALVVVLSGGALLLAAAPLATLVPSVLAGGPAPLAAALVSGLFLAAGAVNCAGRADMAFVISDNATYIMRRSLGALALVDLGAYREACRRARSPRRLHRARRTWHFGAGRRAALSHALASLVRRPSATLGLLGWGGCLVPTGVLLMVGRVNAGVLLAWLLCAGQTLREPLELSCVFRDDCRNRLARSLLPFRPLELLVIDSLPALAVTLSASIAVTWAGATALGAPALPAVLLACVFDVAAFLACGLDDPARAGRRGSARVTSAACTLGTLLCAALLSLLDPMLALAPPLLVSALLAWSLR